MKRVPTVTDFFNFLPVLLSKTISPLSFDTVSLALRLPVVTVATSKRSGTLQLDSNRLPWCYLCLENGSICLLLFRSLFPHFLIQVSMNGGLCASPLAFRERAGPHLRAKSPLFWAAAAGEQEGGESEIIIAPLKVCAATSEMMYSKQQLPWEAEQEAKIAAGLELELLYDLFYGCDRANCWLANTATAGPRSLMIGC